MQIPERLADDAHQEERQQQKGERGDRQSPKSFPGARQSESCKKKAEAEGEGARDMHIEFDAGVWPGRSAEQPVAGEVAAGKQRAVSI